MRTVNIGEVHTVIEADDTEVKPRDIVHKIKCRPIKIPAKKIFSFLMFFITPLRFCFEANQNGSSKIKVSSNRPATFKLAGKVEKRMKMGESVKAISATTSRA